ncbi:diguanylate cyclase (GGDEF) domain-containing protein [Geodermatophilus saharensis]|uniref:Diguanylate cyclase (GGDEF) domain-containing protein n=1 Tax=Geodermatophilus saharensis TaxID=1137994 RepID=A0A239BL51_9ACTN|nr:diguanylate cyclase (GGDEF) domain-containing protein [Geodermatophilus saharensis]
MPGGHRPGRACGILQRVTARRPGPAVPPASPRRDGAEGRAAALLLAALLVTGGATGLVNLALDGVVGDAVTRLTYGATMLACVLAAVPLVVRRRVGRWQTFGLVLLGDLVYAVVALCVEDPVRYATPLMLLFPAVVAAWFLRPWMLAVHMAATPLVVLVALWGSYPSTAALAVQVGVHAGMLDVVAATVSVLRRRERRLLAATEELSQRDPLTGLANRRHLVEAAPRTWRQARREGLRVAAMVIDLDHFKRVNDVHGHAVGDAVLQAVAGALAATVRPSDVLARLGGEELVVLGLVGDPAEAGRLAERLRHAVAAARTPQGHGVTASIGVALTRPVDGEDPAAALWWLVDRADAAMYEAKRSGRDRVAGSAPPRPRPAPAGELLDPPTVPGPALPS